VATAGANRSARSPGQPRSRRALLVRAASLAGGLLAVAETAARKRRKQRRGPNKRRPQGISVSPARVVPGGAVVVTGGGFGEKDGVSVGWSDTGSGQPDPTTLQADGAGRLRAAVELPASPAGAHILSLASGGTSLETDIAVEEPSRPPIVLGVFEQRGGAQAPWVEGVLDDLFGDGENAVNPAVVMWYQGWLAPDGGSSLDTDLLDRVADRGAVPMITWEPWRAGAGRNQKAVRLATIAQALRDPDSAFAGYARSWAVGLRDWIGTSDRRVLLRFAHEMNGTWYPWSVGKNGNDAGDYVAAWQALHDLFVGEGANAVEWVWCPNVHFDGAFPLHRWGELYPGDGFVDWVALDGYNWGTAPGHRWRPFRAVFEESLAKLDEVAPNKPVMIAETGCNPDGGNKAAWIAAALFEDIPLVFPQVRALVWFNANKEHRWRFDSDGASARAFLAAARHPHYRGALDQPGGDAVVTASAADDRRAGDRRRGGRRRNHRPN
jgi:hypothetical protein